MNTEIEENHITAHRSKKDWEKFKKLLRKHPTYQWLDRLSIVERDKADDIRGKDPSFAQKVQPFQRIAMVDGAIRFSNDFRGKEDSSDFEWTNLIAYLGHIYLNTDWNWYEQIEKHGMNFPMARMFNEQFSTIAYPVHVIARANYLFTPYNERIKDVTGLTFEELTRVALGIWGLKNQKGVIRFKKENLINPQVGLTLELIEKFLTHFMADYKAYKEFSERNSSPGTHPRYQFRSIWRYPLINSGKDIWCPLEKVFIKAVFEGLVFLLMDSYRDESGGNAFLDSFGTQYENYISKLLLETGLKLERCDNIPNLKGFRAEFYSTNTKQPIIVECKRFTFRRDTLAGGSNQDFLNDLGKLKHAFSQIENTVKALRKPKATSIIVTYGEIPFSSRDGWRELITEKSDLTANPIILSTHSMELLCSLPHKKVEEALNKHKILDPAKKGSFVTFLQETFPRHLWRNAWLIKKYRETFEESFP